MNVEYQNSVRNDPAFLYSVEFPPASSTCEISFWFVPRGGRSPLTVSLVIDDEVEAVLFYFQTSGNYSTWLSGIIDLGEMAKIYFFKISLFII